MTVTFILRGPGDLYNDKVGYYNSPAFVGKDRVVPIQHGSNKTMVLVDEVSGLGWLVLDIPMDTK